MPMPTPQAARIAGLLAALHLTGCGGGGDPVPAPVPAAVPAPAPTSAPAPAPLTITQRSDAAKATVANASNACQAVKPFYWEIGDASGPLVSGSTDASATYTATTTMSIASASKWIYAAYVAEKRNGALSAHDIKHLHFRSGYASFDAFGSCAFADTVDRCLANGNNGDYTAAADGKFDYDGGHMQKHGSLDGMGALGSLALAAEVRSKLGTDIALSYSQPQLAGGVVTTPGDYARFLRKVLGGQLHIGALLGSSAVCTNPATCSSAIYTPTPAHENWSYSLGHWVDADAVVGDGAFSSTGAFGFHPWIDAGKTSYGVLARRTTLPGTGFESAACGRLIRKAWATGVAQ